MELEHGDAENVTDNSVDEGQMVSESADVDGSEGLEEEASNLDEQEEDLEEQGEDFKEQVEDFTTGGIEFPEGYARSSSAFVIGANHKFPVRSRYLSPSISSCHDLCKFGYKHQEPEKKIRRSFSATTRESRPFTRSYSDNSVTAVLNEGTKKNKDVRRGSLSERDFNQLKFKCTQSEIKPSSIASFKLRNRSESQSSKKILARSSSLLENMNPKVKEMKPKPKPEKGTISYEKEKAEEKTKAINIMSPPAPLKKSSGIKARQYKNLINVSHSKIQSVSNEASRVEPSTDKKSVKKTSKVAPPNEASPSPRRPLVRKNKDYKDNYDSASMSSMEKKRSQSKEETRRKSEPINPKVVRKIKSEDGSRTNSPIKRCSADIRMISRRRGSLPEERDASAWKLKFKRVTMIGLQGSNSSPKKLKFKRGKVLDDDENDKDGIGCELNHNIDIGNEPNGIEPEPEKVQLRHQEASGKKDNVDINNVIEETATKLAQTRKSKVKALVGAFESVMSTHDPESVREAGAS